MSVLEKAIEQAVASALADGAAFERERIVKFLRSIPPAIIDGWDLNPARAARSIADAIEDSVHHQPDYWDRK